MIGYGVKLDASAPIRLQISPSLTIPAGQAGTWSMWIRPNDDARTAILYQHRDGTNALTIGLDQGVPYAEIAAGGTVERAGGGAAISPAAWHHIAVTFADKLAVYVDGESRGDVAVAMPALAGAAVVGGSVPGPASSAPASDAAAPGAPPGAPTAPTPSTTPPAAAAPPGAQPGAPQQAAPASAAPAAPPPNFAGLIDEFRISKIARPVGAIQVWVRSEGPQANLVSFDVPEEASVFGSGYIGIIIRSVTTDAWVVIGILGIMAAISFSVMVAKATYLGRVGRTNRLFREAFRASVSRAAGAASTGLAAISAESQPALRHSPLYRVYEVGVRELLDREENGVIDERGMLPPQSLAAIRASMDAGLVLETQRLNRLMVLLTIAIAGGPFIGLLGTVIGVMITFAAIAAAGDVNVNAIAPGIAAALLATVAGLFVAIPALFGYNYFATRIRDTVGELTVFVDELVTRMGEGVRLNPPVKRGE
jgi:biopolymer transport protein ExbB